MVEDGCGGFELGSDDVGRGCGDASGDGVFGREES